MKVAIINITGGGMSGGYKKYLYNIIPRMAAHPDVDAILCASPDSLNVRRLFNSISNIEFVSCLPYRFMNYYIDRKLSKNLKRFSPDVIFLPMERYFRFDDIPLVNMVQNMEAIALPFENNSFKQKTENLARWIVARYSLKKSQKVIAVSKFVRDFLVKHWNIPSGKVSLIYHGIDCSINKIGQKPKVLPEKWHNNFIFTAGSIRPARGLEDIFFAIKHLSDYSLGMLQLVIAGKREGANEAYHKKLMNMVKKLGLLQKIYWAGYLTDEEMAWCYHNCSIFLMTSRVESFGMIVGEAMSYGCISIAADNPCLPEIFDNAAIYYTPKDGHALAEAIKRVLSWNSLQRNEMSSRAKKRASQFSWDICAEKTVYELKKAIRC